MNQAHFSLWCIISAPLITGMSLKNISQDILDVIVNVDAIAVNQNYLNNAGDVITEFDGISNKFIQQYEQHPLYLKKGYMSLMIIIIDHAITISLLVQFQLTTNIKT